MMDMHMLVLLGGRERTAARYAELFAAAGLNAIRMEPTASPFTIMEIGIADAPTAKRNGHEYGEQP